MSDQPQQATLTGSSHRREFWMLIGYALILGVFGAFLGLAFLGIVKVGSQWFAATNLGWMGGEWWWVAVTAGAGLIVGILHRVLNLPDKTPGVIADLQAGRADPALVPGILVTSAVSLMGGASLGPEKALGSTVGGLGDLAFPTARPDGRSDPNEHVQRLRGGLWRTSVQPSGRGDADT